MPTYRLTADLNDGKNNAPPLEVEVDELLGDRFGHTLGDLLERELVNDYDQLFGVGMTLTVERIA